MAHEERHRDIAKDFTTRTRSRPRPTARPSAVAEKILEKFMKDMTPPQVAMDHREGLLIVEHKGPNGNAGPATGVKFGPAP